MSVYQEFLDHHWEGLTGRAVIATLNAHREPATQKFFQWPDSREELFNFVESRIGEDVYTATTLFKANRAMKRVAKAIQMVHADDDGFLASGGQYRLSPSKIVHTSPGHAHVYWHITDCDDPALIEALAHAVSDAHPTAEGVDPCWAVNHLFRVAGSTNTGYTDPQSKKYDPSASTFQSTMEMTGEVYSYDEFAAAYTPVAAQQVVSQERGTLPTFAEALKSLPASAVLDDLLDTGFSRTEDRSDALHLLQQEVFRLGGNTETAFVICKNAPINKFADRPNGDDKLWEDVLRGRSKSQSYTEVEVMPEGIEITVEPAKKDVSIDFLTSEEKGRMAPTFVDDYVAWAASKTDASSEYHIAGAFTLLSTVFSDYGHAVPRFGKLPLNLWFMVLGDTTRSRKSTAKDLTFDVLSRVADDELYQYDLGSDFSPEALDNALITRPNRSAVLHIDEVQGWLKSVDSKPYLAGVKPKMTDMYGGKVAGKLRNTGDVKRTPATNISFLLYTMGIEEQVAEYLTQEDFQSGFLTRFIYIIGENAERTKASDWLDQEDLTVVKEGDVVQGELVKQLVDRREHWSNFVATDGPTTAVPCKPDAWLRLNKFITDVLDAAEGHDRRDIIAASAQRLTFSLLKSATLLAMYDCCDEVHMEHMLAAINFCGSWFTHMVTMANKVSASGWARRQQAVEDYVMTRGGQAKWETVYNKFRNEVKPREFGELVTALSESGRLHAYWQENPKVRIIELLDQDEEMAA